MKAAIAAGAAWMVFFKFADRSLGIVSTLILARLLVPADFGLVAMAMSVIALIELATSFGFEVALIQKANPDRGHYDTAWTLNVLIGGGCALAIAAVAYPTAAFYGEPRLTALMLVLSVGLLATAFENVGTVDFRRSMNFRREFVFLGLKRLLSFAVTIALAVAFRSYWALVAGMVTSRVAGVSLSFALHPYRPRFSLAASRELFSFSGWMVVNNILSALLTRIPHFFVGRIQGPQALGAYTIGAELAYIPSTELIAPINRAVFSGYARLNEDRDAFRRTFVDVMGAVFLLALPASVGIALVAEPMVRVLLGDNWTEAVPVIRILAFVGAVMSVTSNNVSAYFALGRTGLPPLIMATRIVILVPLLFVLTRPFGLAGAAFAELIATGASLAVSIPMLLSTLKLGLRDYLAALWRPAIASAAMSAVVHFLLGYLRGNSTLVDAAVQLASGIAAGALAYTACILLLWAAAGRPEGAESQILRRILAVIAKLRRSGQ